MRLKYSPETWMQWKIRLKIHNYRKKEGWPGICALRNSGRFCWLQALGTQHTSDYWVSRVLLQPLRFSILADPRCSNLVLPEEYRWATDSRYFVLALICTFWYPFLGCVSPAPPWSQQMKSTGSSRRLLKGLHPSEVFLVIFRQKAPPWKEWPLAKFVEVSDSPPGQRFQLGRILNPHLRPHDPIKCSTRIPEHHHNVTAVHAPSKTFSEDLINTQHVNEPAMKTRDVVYALGL